MPPVPASSFPAVALRIDSFEARDGSVHAARIRRLPRYPRLDAPGPRLVSRVVEMCGCFGRGTVGGGRTRQEIATENRDRGAECGRATGQHGFGLVVGL